ncbi:penicillin acylase family protein [Alicyclobacillus sp. SO9]|uniref:penicillin acylase family protein n=1 Tax=Alicyclobacillus sp. SO9 TaxID=2665646 RepID=UPI0018E7A2A3|nr:penicillin acylase family protein [Alicyclobacillus sp. SO9]QQE77502.1 penicillin acylase family protein [Alicyclobacillus sp. SO9]
MRQRKGMWRGINTGLAVVISAGLLLLGAKGAGPIPAVAAVLNPGTGIWTSAGNANPPKTETIAIKGLNKPVKIRFDKSGRAYIQAQTNHDLFLATGYLHAKFRLFQMDLMRRQGEGRLSQVIGPKALPSDKFELQLGLIRTAKAEWQQMSSDSPAKKALLAYAAGVNDVIKSDENQGKLPVMFKMLGYQPKLWKPVDSLVIQGDMTQTLDFTTGPLEYALLEESLGAKKTMNWFPVLPKDVQHPYDVGPYHVDSPAPMVKESLPSSVVSSSTATQAGTSDAAVLISAARNGGRGSGSRANQNAQAKAVKQLIQTINQLPAAAIHHGSNSNNWAVDGTKTASGSAMMAGDPHLSQTLPAIWYQISGQSPSYTFSGVSIPGIPVILIGRNRSIAWSLTNVQNQATFYYREKTSKLHPNSYFWNGKWRKMEHASYTIPVKGRKSVKLDVKLTVHGPIMTQSGQTLSVDWMGDLPSPDLNALLNVVKATNFAQFKAALKDWHAPSQNFVYADKKGNIGMISAGYYPQVKSGQPWLPMSGTGASDIVGTIPYKDVPQVYDPPSHIVFSANQREVGNTYPYYIGTTMNFFSTGYRADEIYKTLTTKSKLTVKSFEQLQNNTTDYLASEIVPKLESALSGTSLTSAQKQAQQILKNWNENMTANSQGALIWWQFWTTYLNDTFEPWWKAKHVPVQTDPRLRLSVNQQSLDEDLEAWTLQDGSNASFDLPNGTHRTAAEVMRKAFKNAVSTLSKQLGANPQRWQWGKVHFRKFESLAMIDSLSYGPRASGGDDWTVDAADGGMVSTAGPSWRMIVDWSGVSEGVYPGGQSENPVSPWYENFVQTWWDGKYLPIYVNEAKVPGQLVTWTLHS